MVPSSFSYSAFVSGLFSPPPPHELARSATSASSDARIPLTRARIVCGRDLSAAVARAPLFDRFGLLRRSARPAHDDPVVLHELARVRVPVLVALHAAARIALAVERVRVALLLVRPALLPAPSPSSEHGRVVPDRRYTKPPPGAFV